MIIAHIHDTCSLLTCFLVSRSWYIAAVSRLQLALVTGSGYYCEHKEKDE